jgi:hypothetical protein
MRQSLVEYLRELVGGYRSVVAGVVLEVLGVLAIFWSDQRALHIIGVVGVAAGFLVAPFLAFHRIRLQRDTAATSGTLFLRGPRPANELSFGNWSLDSFASPNEDGIAARAMVAAHYSVAATTQFTSALADRVREVLEGSAIDAFLVSLAGGMPGTWQLISPTNDWVITTIRDPVRLGEGWEAWARCIVQLPHSFGGRWPFAVADACFRPIRSEPVADAQFNPALSPKPAGPARLNLFQMRDLLSSLATTVVHDIAPVAFPVVIERTRRERFFARWKKHEGLRLIGPNFDVRSRPHMLPDVLEMPQLTRRPGAPSDNRLYAETPSRVDSYDARQRDHVIAQGIIRCLRQHEYANAETFASELARRPSVGPAG